MKKMTLFLAILILSRVGIAYGADTAPNGLQNFFLGTSNANTANINQVLALLVGPAGPPGAAGVAGRDGFMGMNGVDGMPGAPGPVGQTGAQGIQGLQGVAGAAGAAGAPGPAGAQGPAGPAGSGSGGTFRITGGKVGLTGCDGEIKIEIGRQFTSDGFYLKKITITGINPTACENQKVFVYATADITVRCEKTLTPAVESVTFATGSTCFNDTTNATYDPFYASATSKGFSIDALDSAIGVEITE
jgi:hypothetical protein